MALPKQNRLKGKREFSKLFTGTRPVVSDHFSVRSARNQTGAKSMFAVVVSAKIVALATARNLIRRRTSEAVSHIIRMFPLTPGVSVVVSVRTPRVPEMPALERELLSLMKKSGILIDIT